MDGSVRLAGQTPASTFALRLRGTLNRVLTRGITQPLPGQAPAVTAAAMAVMAGEDVLTRAGGGGLPGIERLATRPSAEPRTGGHRPLMVVIGVADPACPAAGPGPFLPVHGPAGPPVASVMSVRPARRRALMARLRLAAMIRWPDRFRTCDLSSWYRVSRSQCRDWTAQCPRT